MRLNTVTLTGVYLKMRPLVDCNTINNGFKYIKFSLSLILVNANWRLHFHLKLDSVTHFTSKWLSSAMDSIYGTVRI